MTGRQAAVPGLRLVAEALEELSERSGRSRSVEFDSCVFSFSECDLEFIFYFGIRFYRGTPKWPFSEFFNTLSHKRTLQSVELMSEIRPKPTFRTSAVQVTPRIAVSPTLQVIIDPARNPDEDSLFVAGVRTRVAF